MSAESDEEEETFLDAKDTPDGAQHQEHRPQELRRSSRKCKSVSEEIDLEDHRTPKTGKRHRLLGKMGGVQRSPDNSTGISIVIPLRL